MFIRYIINSKRCKIKCDLLIIKILVFIYNSYNNPEEEE